jgi:hypothetical protein
MTTAAQQPKNNDLEWSLESIQSRNQAVDFVRRFESRLCVYSPSVEQCYTNYSLHFPSSENSKMVVLPNPYAFHDTFHGIAQEAVRDTGFHIVPGELIGKTGFYVIVKYKSRDVKPVPIPLKQALKKMIRTRHSEDPFLPILAKGDLREFNASMPCLHLHRLKLADLARRSEFEKASIRNAIVDKLSDLYRDADDLT